MFFVVTTHNVPKFYMPDGSNVSPKQINWIPFEQIKNGVRTRTSDLVPDNSMAAISELYKMGVKGFELKEDAKAFGKTLKIGAWKYLKIG